MITPTLHARDLYKRFGAKEAVRDVRLAVGPGEVVGLLGPNGAGKTTTFNMIVGRVHPTAGRVFLGEEEITDLPMYQRARKGITYLPQEPSIFRKLTVEENILAILETLPLRRSERKERVKMLLGELDLVAKRKQKGSTLSGGERRRVEIARALASRPNYMLLDEPFAGIDPKAVVEIQRLVRHLTNRGIGVLITDHNVRETLALTDRSYIIYSGEVLMEGRQDDIVNDPEVRRLYLGEEFRI
jgi:lipopolysaccharide export system ATP-binding protein